MASSQQHVLLSFVQGDEGKAWAFGRTGWSSRTQAPVCTWDGIACDENQSVIGIDLSSTDFLGTVPTEVGLLTNLRTIMLQHNLLTGTIPSQFFELPNLEEVNLADNRLSGQLFSFASGALTVLDISGNHLNGTIPQNFGQSNRQMTYLDLRENELSGDIPTSWETLTSLTQLSLSKNAFSGTLPTFFGNLFGLKFLYLNENALVGTISPTWGVNGSQLTEVWLQDNLLSGSIPSSLSLLSQLVNLYVDGNKFTGTIPNGICSSSINSDFFTSTAKSLNPVNCGSISCPVGTIAPEGVSPCSSCSSTIIFNPYLGRKGVCQNQTEADIMALLLARTSINSTRIPIQLDSACHYQGVTCNQQGRVVGIDASGTGLTGTIPDELGFLRYLKALNLSGNRMTGFLPSGLRFAPLEELDVSGNQLRGMIPPLLCSSAINGNGANGVYSCNSIACSVGSYGDNGRGQCQPCENGSIFLGSSSCISSSASPQATNQPGGAHVGSIVAFTFVAIAVAASVVGIRYFLSKRLRQRKECAKSVERGQIIREFKGEPNFPHVDEIKGNEPPSCSPSPLLKLLLWFGRMKSDRVYQDNEERIDFRAAMPSDEVDVLGWKERQQFVIDDDDDQSELERIVMKQKMEGGTEVWEYPDPLERSVASWTMEDDLNAQYEYKQNGYYPDDHPKELWLDVPRI